MKTISISRRAVHGLLCGVLFLTFGCKKDEPLAVWDPNQTGGAAPVVTSVSPANAAWSGLSRILINGSGFSNDVLVYIGPSIMPLSSVTPTQITVTAPLDTGSGLAIRVVNRDAFLFASISPYALLSGLKNISKMIDSTLVNVVDVDANETVYAHQLGFVYKIPFGQGQVLLGSILNKVPKASCMRICKDGGLYLANNAGKTYIYRMDLTSGAVTDFVNIAGNVRVFDWGKDGKTIYAGGQKVLAVVDTARKVTKTAYYLTDVIQALRVYDDYVYVAIATGIWRNKINTDGTLGQPEKYFDWTTGPAASATINDITFSNTGDLYIATTYTDPILIVHPDGSFVFLYPGALDSPIANFVWGWNTPYLYMNYQKVGGKRVGRAVMDANLSPMNMQPILGAPYYGRGM